jgi:hypothetical protein
MLLLSDRESDIFEELNIHIVVAPGFVNLHGFSRLPTKIRGFGFLSRTTTIKALYGSTDTVRTTAA